MTYSALKTAVAGYFNRGDLAAKVPDWIARAESFLFREIAAHTLEDTASGTTTGSIALPADFDHLLRLDLQNGDSITTLDYTTQGVGYVIEGSTLRLVNISGSSTYALYYVASLVELSDSAPDNWLLTHGYDLYFYAAALEGARALKNDAEIARIQPMLPGLLDAVRNYASRAKYPQAGGLQIKPRRGFR